MSAASEPAPRLPSDSRQSGPRYSLFWPMLIFLLGAGALTIYQVTSMEERLDEVTQNLDRLDPKVKRAEYEKTKFFAIASDVLRLAPKDPAADKVATFYKLKLIQQAVPELMSMDEPTDMTSTNSAASATTNAPATTNITTPPIPTPAVK